MKKLNYLDNEFELPFEDTTNFPYENDDYDLTLNKVQEEYSNGDDYNFYPDAGF